MISSQTEEIIEIIYESAKQFVIEQQKVSVSFLQRRFRIGYTVAATIVDRLEEEGIVGPANVNLHPRDVLVKE
ncbi:DNA translocase FtsK [Bacillus thuringiensis]|uniref:Cell division protein FtsK n=1 Tax=Bacillus thuringiensis serovar andalousiensis TaxID=257985 RepID=A0A6H0TLW8_BACTU|nr:DNA translocase FtsK [Bacillus thuringiensis]QIW21922.1 cell division protein FtsK [Bacillus thuringiensis serovar andalousiensis]